jgi:hypothetical protein
MTMTNLKLMFAAALLATPFVALAGAAPAAGFNYDYLDVGIDRNEIDTFSSNDPAVLFSKSFGSAAHMRFGYRSIDQLDVITIGLGLRRSIASTTDLVYTVDAQRLSVNSFELPNYEVGVGVRHAFTREMEGDATLVYGIGADGADTQDEFGIALAGRYHLTPQVALGLGVRTFDDLDTLSFTARVGF